ncbi:MAG: SMC-Scp complex subunit ScpB [Clostridia bacterium]|nr:SMC-Scp complex subunit ScpB [Clostridia bacterium]
MELNEIASIVETLMFIVGEPLETEDVKKVINIGEMELWSALEILEQKYSGDSGILLKRFGTKIQLCTNPKNSQFVEDLLNPIQRKSLSQAALEVLSIIAYRQPVTRSEIEQIRGVKCDYSVMSLRQKGLIEEVGHKDVIGRPVLFGTTDLFLRHFGLKTLDDLPEQENLELLENSEFETDEAEQMVMPLLDEKRHSAEENEASFEEFSEELAEE